MTYKEALDRVQGVIDALEEDGSPGGPTPQDLADELREALPALEQMLQDGE